MSVDPAEFLIFLPIGAVAGWLASVLSKFRGLNLLGTIVVGIVGSFIGALVFNALGISAAGLPGSIATATCGAVVLLFLVKLLKK